MKSILQAYFIITIIVGTIIFFAVILPQILKRQNQQTNNQSYETQRQYEEEIARKRAEEEQRIKNENLMQLCRCYQPKYLLSVNEKDQYWHIRKWADPKHLIVFTKVRLLDLITPRDSKNQKLLWKIQAKHLDFVICDNRMNIKCIVEIQDNSHHSQERIERDLFVRTVLKTCGYKLIETYGITDAQLDHACGFTTTGSINEDGHIHDAQKIH